MTDDQLNDEQRAALEKFKTKYGKNWKLVLAEKWWTGADAAEPDGHLLRQIRNRLGPEWLASYDY